MLTPDEEYMLAVRYKERGDRDAADHLVTSHLRLVVKIAAGYRGYGLPMGELISEGNIGLIQAVRRFEPDRGSGWPPTPSGGSRQPSRSTSCVPGAWSSSVPAGSRSGSSSISARSSVRSSLSTTVTSFPSM